MAKRNPSFEEAIDGYYKALIEFGKATRRKALHSPDLKVFRYVAKGKRTPHLYAELADGRTVPLCNRQIDETVGASQIKALRGDECGKCRREAERILASQVELDHNP